MASLSKSFEYDLDTVTNKFLDDFPIHCHYRTGAIGQSQMHSHRGYEFYLCMEGQGKLLVGDRIFALEPGAFTIMKPYVLHWPRVEGLRPLHRFVLSIDERYLFSWLEGLPAIADCVRCLLLDSDSSSLHWQLSGEKLPSVNTLLVQLTKEIAEKPIYYEAAMFQHLAGLFVSLAREQQMNIVKCETNTTPSQLAERILHYLAEHYAERIEVSRLHEQFNVSRSHMYDHFKQWTGHSLNRYLTLYRIDQAKRLLIDTQLSVTEIAAATGFNDLSHFFHTFKSELGLTPKMFRKQHIHLHPI
ncbi:helix-turn-helix domain-containing protein [Paenibacillus sp. GCM10027628]|uniref:AraC family transcriptional regulator n=1 Tax=Paenibacillus sp. GCM10027628 TaxID=3273413 RepID=UPI0036402868